MPIMTSIFYKILKYSHIIWYKTFYTIINHQPSDSQGTLYNIKKAVRNKKLLFPVNVDQKIWCDFLKFMCTCTQATTPIKIYIL